MYVFAVPAIFLTFSVPGRFITKQRLHRVGIRIPKWVQDVAAELFGERHEFTGILASRGPVDQSLILLELGDLTEPQGAAFVGDGDDVGNIARPEAAADA